MILITGHIVVRTENVDSALALGVHHSARSRQEPGCVAHNCFIDAEDPHRIVFMEEWADMEAAMAHFALPASQAFVREFSEMADAAPVMRILKAEIVRR